MKKRTKGLKWIITLMLLVASRTGLAQWEQVNTYYSGSPDKFYFIDENVGFLFNQKYIYKTEDGFETKNLNVLNYEFAYVLDVVFTNPTKGIILSEFDHLFLTNDAGETWSDDVLDLEQDSSLFLSSLYAVDTDTIFAAGYHLIKSVDGGVNWNVLSDYTDTLNSGNLEEYSDKIIWFKMIDNKKGVFISKNSVFKTTDGGLTISRHFEFENKNFIEVYVNKSNIYVLNGTRSTSQVSVFKSIDDGESWEELELPVNRYSDITGIGSDTLMVVGNKGIILDSFDGGLTWNESQIDSTASFLAAYYTTNGVRYAVANYGRIYKNSDFGTITTIDEKQSQIPSGIKLYQNYPNPFNPSTEIQFYLSQSKKVELTIYNLMGQKIDVLLNENMGSGEHRISFNGSHLSSGVYFYELKSDKELIRKTMILIK